jgi:hypothetical protein
MVMLAGCATDSPVSPSGPVNERVVLAPGETASVAGAGTQVRFLGVTGDSRCPADALCIQGGDAVVRIEAAPAGGGSTSPLELHTGTLQPVRYGELTIALETLTPYPFSSRTIAPNEYRATLRITR